MEYSNDYSNVFTIKENKQQTFINALCITKSVKHASLEAGVSQRALFDFMSKNNIDITVVRKLRQEFISSGIKIKLQFIEIKNDEKTSYRKNIKSKKRQPLVQRQNRTTI
jgi:arginine decarboxylase-like protein